MSNIDLTALSHFLHVARHQHLQKAAEEAHVTASALSRSIKKLETQLQTRLFDRIGRQLQLNREGQRLREQATALLSMAERTVESFAGTSGSRQLRLLGPAVLQWRWLGAIAKALTREGFVSIDSETCFEDDALRRLRQGDADAALVSGVAWQPDMEADLVRVYLGRTQMQLAAGALHPLAAIKGSITAEQLRDVAFACPKHSWFCGIERGASSDGWRGDVYPRQIRFWADDLMLLLHWLQTGAAIAYLPDYLLNQAGLERLQLRDCPFTCEESMWLIFRQSTLTGWQEQLLHAISASEASF